MLSTALVMPEDNEEMALTLNGKNRKLKRSDFELSMALSGLEAKIISNIFLKFSKVAPLWFDFIDRSFLNKEMRGKCKAIIQTKLEALGFVDN